MKKLFVPLILFTVLFSSCKGVFVWTVDGIAKLILVGIAFVAALIYWAYTGISSWRKKKKLCRKN